VVSTAGAVTEKEPGEVTDLKEVFDDWISGLKKKIVALASDKHDPGEIASALGMSEKAFIAVMITMVREGSIRITGIHPNQ